MQQFIVTNWLSLLSILIGIVVAYVFFRLQRKDASSASLERKKHSTNELLDVVESYIINKQRLSDHVIDNLIFASERDHAVILRPSCTATSLLQDVALRLQRSRHLDIPQKTEYSEKIEELIQEIRGRCEPAPIEHLNQEIIKKIGEVEVLVPTDKREEARKQLAALVMLADHKREIPLMLKETSSVWAIFTTTMIGLMTALASGFVGNILIDHFSYSNLSFKEELLPILGGFVLFVLLVRASLTLIRVWRRSKYGCEHGKKG